MRQNSAEICWGGTLSQDVQTIKQWIGAYCNLTGNSLGHSAPIQRFFNADNLAWRRDSYITTVASTVLNWGDAMHFRKRVVIAGYLAVLIKTSFEQRMQRLEAAEGNFSALW